MMLKAKIKALRKKTGMNQKALAKKSSITQATISRIESGQVKTLKAPAMKRLASSLGVTVDYLADKSAKLTTDNIVVSDPVARKMVKIYRKLDAVKREQLASYAEFLHRPRMTKPKKINLEVKRKKVGTKAK